MEQMFPENYNILKHVPSSLVEILLAFQRNVLLPYAEYTHFLFLVNLSWIIRDATPSNTTYILHKFKTTTFFRLK